MPRCLLVPLFVLVALLPFAGVSAAHSDPLEVVASGLDNPRGLDFGPWGGLYVAEAGRGGDGPCIETPAGSQCVGATGAITKVWHGKQRRIITGLPSIATPADGSDALGPHDISLSGFSAYFVVGLGGNPTVLRPLMGELGPEFGQLYRISPFGRVRPVADLAQYEADEDPDGVEINSNPVSVLARHGRQYVVDAGGNDLLKVGHNGRISTVAVFPDVATDVQAVPTAVVRGPDRDLYVSQLTGAPFLPDIANIYRVERDGDFEVYESGFTNVTDLAFGPDGSLYVVEIATEGLTAVPPSGGSLIRVAPDGTRETIASGLDAPYGVAVSRRGHIYVSTHSTEAGTGEVVRVHPGG